MDNRKIDVLSDNPTHLKAALGIIWDADDAMANCLASHYLEVTHEGLTTLILLWHEEGDAKPLPYALNQEEALTFIVGWLNRAKYPNRPDMDGDCEPGWRLFTEAWGHVLDHHYAKVGIQPAWALYGK